MPVLSLGAARRAYLFRSRLRPFAYISAAFGPFLIVGSKVLFTESPGDTPFLLLLGQVALAGAIGGFFPALLGTIVSAASVTYLLLPPSQSFVIAAGDTDRVLLFVAEGLIVSAIVGILHRSWHETRHVLAATRAADDRVREAWRMRTSFYAEASHDIRQPLSRLLAQLLLARRQLTPADGEAPLALQLDASIDAARALSRQINELLEPARIESQAASTTGEPVDLALLIDSIHEEFSRSPQRSPIELERPGHEVWIKGDEFSLSSVIRHLVDNALKYGEGRPILLETAVAANQREALVRVSDNGIGIPSAERDRIFEPFYRASNAGSTSGHGLGLSISRRIVEQHGGRLWLDRSDGGGTTFALALPLVARSRRRLVEILNGDERLSDVREWLGIPLRDTHSKTLSDLFVERLGRTAAIGDVVLEDGVRFEVVEIQAGRSIGVLATRSG
jgi:signal transduction histidine kinase